jgi:DNA-binding response OmpR family regulator
VTASSSDIQTDQRTLERVSTSVESARILVVDDDPKIRSFLVKGLTEMGMRVESAQDAKSALDLLHREPFEMVLLDVMLPDMPGWDVLSTIREEQMDTPVILVTARDAVDERIKGLLMGGDDYVVKPFVFAELWARIQAVLRRDRAGLSTRVGDLLIDHVRGLVSRAGTQLDLTRIEFGLLRRLAEHAGQTVSRGQLLDSVWGIQFDPGTNVVDVHIRRLRQKIDRPFDSVLIHTIRGQGYVLESRG